MLRLIWKTWRRHKERLLLLLVGALIISTGLSYLLGLSETNKGTIVDTLRKNWKAQYHILVRPPGSRGETESEGLLSPNYLSGISGGISLKQWQTIKNISDVETAAPLAVIGYTNYQVTRSPESLKQPETDEIYRRTQVIKEHNGYQTVTYKETPAYFTGDSRLVSGKNSPFGQPNRLGKIGMSGYVLLAGVDPDAEADLVGLDEAVSDKGQSRYFTSDDQVDTRHQEAEDDPVHPVPEQQHTKMPVLLNNQTYTHTTFNFSIERIKLSSQQKAKLKEKLKNGSAKKYLDSLKGEQINDFSYTSGENYRALITGLAGKILEQKDSPSDDVKVSLTPTLDLKSGPINYESVKSPFPDRWPFAYRVVPVSNSFSDQFKEVYQRSADGYRSINMINDWSDEHYLDLKKFINPYFIGVYDSSQLKTAKNPLTKLPMQTYRPPGAKLVVDSKGELVNPPPDITPIGSPGGFLLEPPTMLTTIEAASQIIGDKPISSIRVKVSGVDQMNDASQAKLEKVAQNIEDKTGLITDVTLGSSPQPTLLHIPASGKVPELGWVQMPWIHLGASYTIFNETKIGFSGIIFSVMLVAIAYVLATTLVSFLRRRKEFAILLAIGWRPAQLIRMLMIEAIFTGLFAAAVAWIIEGIYFWTHPASFSLFKLLIVGILGLFIYLLGAAGPAFLITRLSPYEAMKSGEIRKSARRVSRSKGISGMSFNHLTGKLGRNTMSIFAMAFPTMLLAFFLFISFHLKGVLYTTWLGQYAALQVGTSHYIAMLIAMAISVLTTTEIMWQNISERKSEIALLKAIGWRNHSIRLLILMEGLWTGLVAGILGVLLAAGLIYLMYHELPLSFMWLIAATAGVPAIIGVLGAVLPSEIAVRVSPIRGMRAS